MNVCKDEIRDAIEHELVSANEIHPLFASLHEAYAVMREEFEEMEEQVDICMESMQELWRCIKKDHEKGALEELGWVRAYAEKAAKEACQVAAMAIKAEQSYAAWSEEKEIRKEYLNNGKR